MGLFPLGFGCCARFMPVISWHRICVRSSGIMDTAQVQALHVVIQKRICWRFTLPAPCQPLTGVCLVRFEKSGKGRRLWHQESGQLNHLAGWLLLPRERVAGGMIPYYSMHRTKAVLRGHAAPGPLDHAISTRWAVSTQASPWCRAASRIRPGPLRVSCARSVIATILAPAPASVHLHLARGLRFSVSIKGLLH